MTKQVYLWKKTLDAKTDDKLVSIYWKPLGSASLAFVREIHRWPVNSPHKVPVTRKMFPFDDVIIMRCIDTYTVSNSVTERFLYFVYWYMVLINLAIPKSLTVRRLGPDCQGSSYM